MMTLNPRIYVACLAAYNSGYLHGAWIDATQDVDFMHDKIKEILASSPIKHAEEWSIHDHEGFGEGLLNEYTSLEKVFELALFISDHGELGSEVLSYAGGEIDSARCYLEDCYQGEFDNEEDFAYYWTNEIVCREIPDYLSCYIDYQAMARDFFINDFFSLELNHKIHVFTHQ